MKRLDIEMHARGIVRSRSAATDLIKRGKVAVNGKVVSKPSQDIAETDIITLEGGTSYVSRAAEKLAYALSLWKIDVTGQTALDIGASTGGFTDCLLKNGAARVVAVDVGTGQLDAGLRADPRVESYEGTDIRDFTLKLSADIVTIDVSFISLEFILPKAFSLLKKGGQAIALVKPQFEVGKEIADRHKGIITGEDERQAALAKVQTAAARAGFKTLEHADSPLEGEKGNKEFLLLLKK